jgi:hypothetical protein
VVGGFLGSWELDSWELGVGLLRPIGRTERSVEGLQYFVGAAPPYETREPSTTRGNLSESPRTGRAISVGMPRALTTAGLA